MSQAPKSDDKKEDKQKKKDKPVVWVIYYSKYGHVHTMAEHIEKGLKNYVDVKLHRLPDENVDKEKIIENLGDADAFLFGIPTRFGTMPSQMKAFFDSLGGHWYKGSLIGKMAGFFFSAHQHKVEDKRPLL